MKLTKMRLLRILVDITSYKIEELDRLIKRSYKMAKEKNDEDYIEILTQMREILLNFKKDIMRWSSKETEDE